MSDKDKKTTPVEIAVVLNDLAMFMKHHSNGAATVIILQIALSFDALNFTFLFFFASALLVFTIRSTIIFLSGKKILTGLNCKEMILSYLMSDNDTIKREAIVCVSEMLTASM